MEEAATTIEPITGEKRPRDDDPLPLLPPGWIEAKDPRYRKQTSAKQTYWYHADTKQTSWSRPPGPPDGAGAPPLSVDLPSTDEASPPPPPLPLPRTPLTAPPPPPASGAAPERKRDSKSPDGTPGVAPPAPPPGKMDEAQGGGTGRAGPERFAPGPWRCKCGWHNRVSVAQSRLGDPSVTSICGGQPVACNGRQFGCGGQRSRCEVTGGMHQATISMEEATRQIAAAGGKVGGSVVSFDAERGFGFIAVDGDKDHFVHVANLLDGGTLTIGAHVTFVSEYNHQKARPVAKQVARVENGGPGGRGGHSAPASEEHAREKRERERAERRTREEVLRTRADAPSVSSAAAVAPLRPAALRPAAAVYASLSLEGAMVRLTVRVDTAWRAVPSPLLRSLALPFGAEVAVQRPHRLVPRGDRLCCDWANKGCCAVGEQCLFAHGEAELRAKKPLGHDLTWAQRQEALPPAAPAAPAPPAATSAPRHRVQVVSGCRGCRSCRGAPAGEECAREKRERERANAPSVSPAAAAVLCPAAAVHASLSLEGAMVRLTVRVDTAWRAEPSLPLQPLSLPFGAEAAVRGPPRLALCGASSAARKLCRNWADKGSCAYGEQCVFAHGEAELLRVQSAQLGINSPPGCSTEALPQHPSPAPPAPSVAQQRRDNWGKMQFLDDRDDARHPPASGSHSRRPAAIAADPAAAAVVTAAAAAVRTAAYLRPALGAAAASFAATPAAAPAPRSCSWGRGRRRSRSHSRERSRSQSRDRGRSRSRSRSASPERRRSNRGQSERARSKKDVTARLDLLPAQVSLILGFGGTSIAALKQVAGVTSVRVQNKDSPRPYVIMTGHSRDAVALAEKIVRALLRAAGPQGVFKGVSNCVAFITNKARALQEKQVTKDNVDDLGRRLRPRRRRSGSCSDSGSGSGNDSDSESGSDSGLDNRRDSRVGERRVTSCLRLVGLPLQASEPGVSHWFACAPGGPINVLRVLFTYNKAGRKNGEAVRAPRPYAWACLAPHSLLPYVSSLSSCPSSRRSGRCSGCTITTCRTAISRFTLAR